MAHLRQKKGSYYAEFYDPCRHPKLKYVPLRTKDKQAARTRLVSLEREYAAGERDPWEGRLEFGGVAVNEAVAQYLDSRKDRRPRTRRSDKSLLEAFAGSLHPGCMVHHVERRHVEAFLNAPTKGGAQRVSSTKNTYYARLSAFFNWCIDRDLIRDSPLVRVVKPRVEKKVPLFLSKKHYDKLLKTIADDVANKGGGHLPHVSLNDGEIEWLLDVVRFAVGTGMRLSEICYLRWGSVDLDHEQVTVKNHESFRSKSGHERTVPVAGDALRVLRRLHSQSPSSSGAPVFTAARGGILNATYVSKRFKHYVIEAKLSPSLRFHDLRHTYASWLVQDGVSLFVVKDLLGHQSFEMTQRYSHLAPDTLRAAVRGTFSA